MFHGIPRALTLTLVAAITVLLLLAIVRIANATPMQGGPISANAQGQRDAKRGQPAPARNEPRYWALASRLQRIDKPRAWRHRLDPVTHTRLLWNTNMFGPEYCPRMSPAAIEAEATPGPLKAPIIHWDFEKLTLAQKQQYYTCYADMRKVWLCYILLFFVFCFLFFVFFLPLPGCRFLCLTIFLP